MARPPDLDLSGQWRAAPAADEGLRLRYVDDDLDDSGWERLPIPGHWRSSPAFASSDGPVLYRTRFTEPAVPEPADPDGGRAFLVLEGVMAASDVWLDGTYLGDTSGYVAPHAFEVTDLLRARPDHLLAMEVANGPVGPGRTRDLTGALGRSALIGTPHNPGGIWRPVRVTRTGPVRLRYSRLRCPTATAARAVLALRAVLDTEEARTVTLRTSVRLAVDAGGHPLPGEEATMVVEREHPLAAGENRVEWTVGVPDPELWWPRSLGGQPRYDVTLEALVDDVVSDDRTWRTGLRQVRLDDFVCRVNDERLFLKGVSAGPTNLLLADATVDEVTADVTRVAEAGLDLIRVHGHIARPELYDAADAAGILVWQDLPLQWGLQRAAKEPARRIARAAVDALGHHPSIAVWCAHHEPWVGDPATRRDPGTRRRAECDRPWRRPSRPGTEASSIDRSPSSSTRATGADPWWPTPGCGPTSPSSRAPPPHLWAGWRWGDIDPCRACCGHGPDWGDSSASSAPRPRARRPGSSADGTDAGPTSTGTRSPPNTPSRSTRRAGSPIPPTTPTRRPGRQHCRSTRPRWCAATSSLCAG